MSKALKVEDQVYRELDRLKAKGQTFSPSALTKLVQAKKELNLRVKWEAAAKDLNKLSGVPDHYAPVKNPWGIVKPKPVKPVKPTEEPPVGAVAPEPPAAKPAILKDVGVTPMKSGVKLTAAEQERIVKGVKAAQETTEIKVPITLRRSISSDATYSSHAGYPERNFITIDKTSGNNWARLTYDPARTAEVAGQYYADGLEGTLVHEHGHHIFHTLFSGQARANVE